MIAFLQALPNLNYIPAILRYGLPGLAFLLAMFAFVLLRKEGSKHRPNPSMLGSIRWFMILSIVLGLGSGLIQNLSPAKPDRVLTGLISPEVFPRARKSFVERKGGTEIGRFRGRWIAKWFTTDENGTKVPLSSDPEDRPEVFVKGAEIFCQVLNVGPNIQLSYWMYGRVSTNDYVSLVYWGDSGYENEPMVGVVFLKVVDKVGQRLRLEGTWSGYTTENKVVEGSTVWVRQNRD